MKVTRLEFIDSFQQTEESGTFAFDFDTVDSKRVVCRVEVTGFVDEDRYCVVLQDEKGNIVDLSLIFEVTQKQINEIEKLHITVNLACARLTRGSFGCVKISELQSSMLPTTALPKGKNGGERGSRKPTASGRSGGKRR